MDVCSLSRSLRGRFMNYRTAILLVILVSIYLSYEYISLFIYGKTNLYRDNFFCTCGKNDAVLINSSYFISNGSIYYFKKGNTGWRIVKKTDITKYLKGWYVVYQQSDEISRLESFYQKIPLAYNDDYIAVLLSKSCKQYSRKSDIGSVLVFKKNNGDIKYYCWIDNVAPRCVSLTKDNELIVIDNSDKNQFFTLKFYDLNNKKPILNQEIYPIISNNSDNENIKNCQKYFREYFINNNNLLLVRSLTDIPDNEKKKLKCTIGFSVDYLLLEKIDGKWKYIQSLLPEIPKEYSSYCNFDPLMYVTCFDLDEMFIQLSIINPEKGEKSIIEYKRDMATGQFFVDSIKNKEYVLQNATNDSHDDSTRENLVIQSRNRISIAMMNKSTELGIVSPSYDDSPDIIPPKWIVQSCDKNTLKLFLEYYKANIVSRYAKEDGYRNFYEYTNAIPIVHYSINDSCLMVSYVFKDCYFRNGPMQKINEVWAGVDFYQIDDKLGPVKTSSFTTRNLEQLKPREINDE